MDLTSIIKDIQERAKKVYKPVEQALIKAYQKDAPKVLSAVANPGNAAADYIVNNYLYNQQTQRPFPSSPAWVIIDANKINDPQARQEAMVQSVLPLVMGISGGVTESSSTGRNLVTQGERAALPAEGGVVVNVRNRLTGEVTPHGPYQSNRVGADAMTKIPLGENEIGMMQKNGPSVLDELMQRKADLTKGGYNTASVDKAIQREMQVGKQLPKELEGLGYSKSEDIQAFKKNILTDENLKRNIAELSKDGLSPDENGLITLYRGHSGKGNDKFRAFSYFSTNKNLAQRFGRNVETVKVNPGDLVITNRMGEGITFQNPVNLVKDANGIHRIEPLNQAKGGAK